MKYTVELNYLDEQNNLQFRQFEGVDNRTSVTGGVVTIWFAGSCMFIIPLTRLISMEVYPSE